MLEHIIKVVNAVNGAVKIQVGRGCALVIAKQYGLNIVVCENGDFFFLSRVEKDEDFSPLLRGGKVEYFAEQFAREVELQNSAVTL